MIDCKITENFFKEYIRMCEGQPFGCKLCPISEAKGGTLSYFIEEKPQKVIEIVQKWSDEHPAKTLLDDFKEKNPNYKKGYADCPTFCPFQIGYEEYKWCINGAVNCAECWNRPLDEVMKK